MKCYKDSTGHLHRTQAEAKASGHPFETEIVPNDQQGQIDYMNALRQPTVAPEPEDPEPTHATWPGDEDRPYQNGDPTRPFLGSRDPAAIFTCTTCGAKNVNVAR